MLSLQCIQDQYPGENISRVLAIINGIDGTVAKVESFGNLKYIKIS